MRGFTEVTTEEELKTFEDVTDGFWDAIVKEARLLNRGHVEKDSRILHPGRGFDVQILFQSQQRDHDVEVILCRAESCSFDAFVFEDGMTCSIDRNGPKRVILFGSIYADQLFYRTCPKSGQGAVLGTELPSSVAVPASLIEPGWRQCSECCDAWQAPDDLVFSRCPSCGNVTELPERTA